MKRLTLINLTRNLPDLEHHPVEETPTQVEHKVLKTIALLEEARSAPVPFERLEALTTLKTSALCRVVQMLVIKGMVYRSGEDLQYLTHNPKALSQNE